MHSPSGHQKVINARGWRMASHALWRVLLPVMLLSCDAIGEGTPRPVEETLKPLSQAKPKHFRLLLATGNRVLWYLPHTGEERVLRVGGVHYGTFPGELSAEGRLNTIWASVRFEKKDSNDEYLVEIDAGKGGEIRRVLIPGYDTHDVIRYKGHVYTTYTHDGQILELKYGDLMEKVREHKLFNESDHINTLARLSDKELWVMRHMLGQSILQKIEVLPDGMMRKRLGLTGFGKCCHGIVRYDGGFLTLDSDGGALVHVKENGCWATLYKDPFGNRFAKGLNVVDGVAYFGLSKKAKRKDRLYPNAHGELAAYHLKLRRLLWRRTITTSGLLNSISAPQYGENSTFVPVVTGEPDPYMELLNNPPPRNATLPLVNQALSANSYEPVPSGFWPSGAPYMNLENKASATPWLAGNILTMGQVDVRRLRAKIMELPEGMWSHEVAFTANKGENVPFSLAHQQDSSSVQHTARFPNVVWLIQSSALDLPQSNLLPYYEMLSFELEPLIKSLLGPDGLNYILSMRLEKVDRGLPAHRDHDPAAARSHRIVIPVIPSPVTTRICAYADKKVKWTRIPESQARKQGCTVVPDVPGAAMELNNKVMHFVEPPASEIAPGDEGIILVIDAADMAAARKPPKEFAKPTGCRDPIQAGSL